jgi:hypothetical protein
LLACVNHNSNRSLAVYKNGTFLGDMMAQHDHWPQGEYVWACEFMNGANFDETSGCCVRVQRPELPPPLTPEQEAAREARHRAQMIMYLTVPGATDADIAAIA